VPFSSTFNGAGTNLKVGAPVYIIWREAPENLFFFGRAPPLFGSISANSCFGERFRDGQYSLVSFLFAVLLLTVPPCNGVGATVYIPRGGDTAQKLRRH